MNNKHNNQLIWAFVVIYIVLLCVFLYVCFVKLRGIGVWVHPLLMILYIVIVYIVIVVFLIVLRYVVRKIDKLVILKNRNISLNRIMSEAAGRTIVVLPIIAIVILLLFECGNPNYHRDYWRDADNIDYIENHIP